MTETLRSVVIGCGVGGQGRAGVHSIGYLHGETYRRSDHVELVAAADLVEENAQRYADYFGIEHTYTDFEEMLRVRNPILSACAPGPHSTPEMVIAAANAGQREFWSEKPMALSRNKSTRCSPHVTTTEPNSWLTTSADTCRSFRKPDASSPSADRGDPDHPRRYRGWDLLSWAPTWVDMYRFLLANADAKWWFAQVDVQNRVKKYGHLVEDHALTCFAFEGGIHAFLETGRTVPAAPTMRIAGTDGLSTSSKAPLSAPEAPALRYFSPKTNGWTSPALPATRILSRPRLIAPRLGGWIHGGRSRPFRKRCESDNGNDPCRVRVGSSARHRRPAVAGIRLPIESSRSSHRSKT